ncbi:hypothetical protein PXK00_02350 [Phaeobacter sp. QD34_3]|uniref:hypothetical protein n=1 Tax=unclassified Phaeobacter TaxID=2621772 RepID=UPI00237F5909|nr:MULTISPECIES: hypothetical protein [unclassified Phaeobacter]MDE4131934.1 hypothetical protein [Phaeobacter sp. QD34_3]MDE4135572.1 hypothetical protein [Phaeobacter sp. QD34_24]MDE4173561.1 hypothetical protein [Phaeobacter sp. PT47_59]
MKNLQLGALICAAAMSLAGCFGSTETVPVNLDFSRTNYGFINSGGYAAGSFFAWNKAQDELVFLGNVPGFEPPEPGRGRDVVASYAGGLEIGGEYATYGRLARAKADAWVRRISAFEIKNGTRVAYSNVYTKITDHLSKDMADGGSLIEEWGISEAIGDPDQRFIIVRDVTYGDTIRLQVDAEAGADGSLSVPVKDGSIKVRLNGRGLEGIAGDNIEITFFVYVLEPYWKQEDGVKTLAVRRIKSEDISGLPGLLRRVGVDS